MNAPRLGLPPGQHLAAPGKWPVIGERQPRHDDLPWQVNVNGCVRRPARLLLEDLRGMPQVERVVDIHCVTRWSKLGVRFEGVPLRELMRRVEPTPEARFVSFVARSERAHSTSLPLEDLLELDALVALSGEHRPLPSEHGGPVRLVVPGRYFYKSIKWLERIELLAEDRLGHWEATAGYHNTADPWREQRFMAATLTKQQAAAVIAARDFSVRDLRSIDASGRDLTGLDARGALLRNADFRKSKLRGARFDGSNLSNAHFQGADLREASFVGADLEGASFSQADLRGADLTGASLFGATFVHESQLESGALIDRTTHLDAKQLDALMPHQLSFMRKAVKRDPA
jgi:DMSO/TMAO reductase YedYZ molybdopterin-dependent catalytic subunit